jgi:hypothetical protein
MASGSYRTRLVLGGLDEWRRPGSVVGGSCVSLGQSDAAFTVLSGETAVLFWARRLPRAMAEGLGSLVWSMAWRMASEPRDRPWPRDGTRTLGFICPGVFFV